MVAVNFPFPKIWNHLTYERLCLLSSHNLKRYFEEGRKLKDREVGLGGGW